MFSVGSSAPPPLALFRVRIALNRSQCLEDPLLAKADGNRSCPAAATPTWLKNLLNAEVVVLLVVSTFKQYSHLPFEPQLACVKAIFSLTSFPTSLIKVPLSHFQPQDPFSRGEADTRDLTPLPALHSSWDCWLAVPMGGSTAHHPHPAALSHCSLALGYLWDPQTVVPVTAASPHFPGKSAGAQKPQTKATSVRVVTTKEFTGTPGVFTPRQLRIRGAEELVTLQPQGSRPCSQAAGTEGSREGAGPVHVSVNSARWVKWFCYFSRTWTSEGVVSQHSLTSLSKVQISVLGVADYGTPVDISSTKQLTTFTGQLVIIWYA